MCAVSINLVSDLTFLSFHVMQMIYTRTQPLLPFSRPSTAPMLPSFCSDDATQFTSLTDLLPQKKNKPLIFLIALLKGGTVHVGWEIIKHEKIDLKIIRLCLVRQPRRMIRRGLWMFSGCSLGRLKKKKPTHSAIIPHSPFQASPLTQTPKNQTQFCYSPVQKEQGNVWLGYLSFELLILGIKIAGCWESFWTP